MLSGSDEPIRHMTFGNIIFGCRLRRVGGTSSWSAPKQADRCCEQSKSKTGFVVERWHNALSRGQAFEDNGDRGHLDKLCGRKATGFDGIDGLLRRPRQCGLRSARLNQNWFLRAGTDTVRAERCPGDRCLRRNPEDLATLAHCRPAVAARPRTRVLALKSRPKC
jgi:hypothetical protein